MKADRYRYDDHDRPDLRDLPTHAGVDKDCREEIEEKTAENIETMKELQDALYADGREGIVIVLQAMDAAGKDSTSKCLARAESFFICRKMGGPAFRAANHRL